jgi:NCAIR mutase (PurE)-related protein
MTEEQVRLLFKKIQSGTLNEDTFVQKLRTLPFENIHFAHLDHHRSLRNAIPEVIYGEGKSTADVKTIVKKMLAKKLSVMITRVTREQIATLKNIPRYTLFEKARIIFFPSHTKKKKSGKIVIVSAGTSDSPIAEEAAVTAELLGSNVLRLFDVGVAGIHRLLMQIDIFENARCVVCVAGMDGALPSVVGGLLSCPVIAVPTSVGYGASFNGVAALLTMLNSCASGISVVNIDNGFGAGYQAHLINTVSTND